MHPTYWCYWSWGAFIILLAIILPRRQLCVNWALLSLSCRGSAPESGCPVFLDCSWCQNLCLKHSLIRRQLFISKFGWWKINDFCLHVLPVFQGLIWFLSYVYFDYILRAWIHVWDRFSWTCLYSDCFWSVCAKNLFVQVLKRRGTEDPSTSWSFKKLLALRLYQINLIATLRCYALPLVIEGSRDTCCVPTTHGNFQIFVLTDFF